MKTDGSGKIPRELPISWAVNSERFSLTIDSDELLTGQSVCTPPIDAATIAKTTDNAPVASLRLHGVALSRAGRELFNIVEVEPDERYTEALREFFNKRKLTMTPVGA